MLYVGLLRGHVQHVAVTLQVQDHPPGGGVTMLVLTLSVDGDMTVLRFRSKFSKYNCQNILLRRLETLFTYKPTLVLACVIIDGLLLTD